MGLFKDSCETEKKTNTVLYIIIIVLLAIIAIGAFFVGKNMGNNGGDVKKDSTNTSTSKSITITVIDDKRCTNCMTDQIVSQLKQVPFLAGAEFVQKDFSDKGVDTYLKDNSISKLPAIILSSNDINDNGQMKPYLKELKDKQYSLEIGASFDPYAKRSAKGFLLLDKDTLNKIKANTYLQGNKDAKVSWIEYSDLECPFCAKLHKSDVPSKIKETYGDKVNKYFNNFPLEFHKNALPAAEIIECLGEQKGADAFYSLIKNSYDSAKQLSDGNIDTSTSSSKDFLISEAVKLGADKTKLENCVNEEKYSKKISEEQSVGASTFGISGTPGNILVNNDTGEYEVISGAYPFESFKQTIDALLK
nr:thioredoxin domain-containing protein [Candidatus Gracilibacteria bacterium]